MAPIKIKKKRRIETMKKLMHIGPISYKLNQS